MKQIQVKCLGIRYPHEVPETTEEYDALAGKQGAALESATSNVIYRSSNAVFRRELASLVEDSTGIERKTEQTGTKTVKVKGEDGEVTETEEPIVEYSETEKTYFDRVCDELGLETEEAKQAKFADEIEQAAAKATFDPTQREASAGGKSRRAKKRYRTFVETVLEEKGEEVFENLRASLSDKLEREIPAESEAVALAMQEWEESRDLLSEALDG